MPQNDIIMSTILLFMHSIMFVQTVVTYVMYDVNYFGDNVRCLVPDHAEMYHEEAVGDDNDRR